MSNYLSESGWKTVAKKAHILDPGLQKKLKAYENVIDDKLQEKLNALAEVGTVAKNLQNQMSDSVKSAKKYHAKPDQVKNLENVVKYLAEVNKAVDAKTTELKKAIKTAADAAAAAVAAKQPPMLDRLVAAADTISGSAGGRLKKVMAIAKRKASSWKELWYYNSYAVFQFVKAKRSEQESMAKVGGGKLPFKGDKWVVFPFKKNLDSFCPTGCADERLVRFLISTDDDIVSSLRPLTKAQNKTEASLYGPSVLEFMKHVASLAKDSNHLYSADY
jgi:hypothetical protein